ncbi:MAG: hypothetical protein ACKV0T_26055 [Planctomycetales bacterium]
MWNWFQQLDRILRGDATRPDSLREGRIDVPLGGLSVVLVVLGLITGVVVGTFAVFREGGPFWTQWLASTIKVPALFFLTLAVTFPSLYVFNALVGSKLTMVSLLRLLTAALGVTLAVLAAFGPIVAFFSVSTTSYPFMLLLNVVVFGVAGILGLKFLLQTLHRLSVVEKSQPEPPPVLVASEVFLESSGEPVQVPEPQGALDPLEGHPLGKHVKLVFRLWVILFGLVGAQMSWVLRPIIGNPDQPFEWFRTRQSNFFEAVWQSILNLFS